MKKGFELLFGNITPEELKQIEQKATDRQRNAEQFQHRDRYENSDTETDNNILRA